MPLQKSRATKQPTVLNENIFSLIEAWIYEEKYKM